MVGSSLLLPLAAKPALTSLTALIIVPFAFSAMIAPIWGYVALTRTGSVTGVQLGVIFMVGGFVWLIIAIITIYLSGGEIKIFLDSWDIKTNLRMYFECLMRLQLAD